jgi:hypothetical protein
VIGYVHFVWEKEDFENRKEIYSTHLNGKINRRISALNYELIKTKLTDCDWNKKTLNKTILKDVSSGFLSTIKNY